MDSTRKTQRRFSILGALSLTGAMLLAACSSPAPTATPIPPTPTKAPPTPTAMAPAPTAAAAAAPTSNTQAAALRSTLNLLLSEHIILAADATGAALGGRTDEFNAAAAALDANSVDLSKAIGAAYGADAEKAFLGLWRTHIGFFVDYTTGVAANDKAKQDKAVNDLAGYTQSFGAFINGATGIPTNAVADLVKTHVLTLKDVVDAQAAKEQDKAYAAIRKAYGHMHMVADPLAEATAKKTGNFPGDPNAPAAGLRSGLNTMLQEHAYLAAAATGAALGGRNAEFQAAAGALDANSVDLSKAIGSVYGSDAEKAFLGLWRTHIGFFVDYTTGAAANDKAKQDKAVNDLVGYTQSFGAFINGAAGLPTNTVADLVKSHVLTLKDVVDAQAAKDNTKAYTALRAAAGHMHMVGDPLAEAIVGKFPEKFRATSGTGSSSSTPAPTMSAAAGAGEVHINLFVFKPDPIKVAPGAKVTWMNMDDTAHALRSGTPEAPTTVFDGQSFSKGQSYSATFASAGTYPYFCKLHPSMKGTVQVS